MEMSIELHKCTFADPANLRRICNLFDCHLGWLISLICSHFLVGQDNNLECRLTPFSLIRWFVIHYTRLNLLVDHLRAADWMPEFLFMTLVAWGLIKLTNIQALPSRHYKVRDGSRTCDWQRESFLDHLQWAGTRSLHCCLSKADRLLMHFWRFLRHTCPLPIAVTLPWHACNHISSSSV